MRFLKSIFENIVRKTQMKGGSQVLDSRFQCPCCGYPTLNEFASYEICELCNWEDDGQSDKDADEVRGGPNSDYSLTEARHNFAQFRVMYRPERDMRIGGADSSLEWETKGLLIEAYSQLKSRLGDQKALQKEIYYLEEVLKKETARRVKEYEDQHTKKG
jgi:hypothetical protein